MITFEFIKGVPTIKNKVKEAVDEVKSSLQKRANRYFGEDNVKSQMFETGYMFDRSKSISRSQRADTNNPAYQNIYRHYKDAWEKRYSELQTKHKNVGSKEHVEYKQAAKGKPARHNDRVIDSDAPTGTNLVDGWTLWTGLLFNDVSLAFEEGGGPFLGLANLVSLGGFSLSISRMPTGEGGTNFYEIFTEHFKTIGVIGAEGPLSFQRDDWSKIAAEMRNNINKQFVQPLKKELSNLEVRV